MSTLLPDRPIASPLSLSPPLSLSFSLSLSQAAQTADIFDSLELGTMCHVPPPPPTARPGPIAVAVPASATAPADAAAALAAFSARWCPRSSSSAEDGPGRTSERSTSSICVGSIDELKAALGTIAAADAAAGGARRMVRMAPGLYRLNETMVLGPEHSGTTIDAPGGGVTISGTRMSDMCHTTPATFLPPFSSASRTHLDKTVTVRVLAPGTTSSR